MKRKEYLFVLVLVALFTTAGTAAAQPIPTPPSATNFVVHLSGDEQVPPVDTMARGQATFQLNRAGTLSHRLIVASIENKRHLDARTYIGLTSPGSIQPCETQQRDSDVPQGGNMNGRI